ncbi:hypothetical protein C8Q80DRAFT_1179229 [Daedaleopsis nitida]|nr:hypothetical protein C8Q80DRAFT_1179229 [Daedaleopsis nitida]
MDYFNIEWLAAALNQARTRPYSDTILEQKSARSEAAAALSKHFPSSQVRHALRFIEVVRKEFSRRPGAYDQFFQALKLYENQTLDLKDTIIRIMLLCCASPLLLREVNSFLPYGWRFEVLMGDVAVGLITPDERILYPLATSLASDHMHVNPTYRDRLRGSV